VPMDMMKKKANARAPMSAVRVTINRLIQRISAQVPGHLPVLAVVVWRNPEETEGEAIKRHMREHPETAAMPEASLTIHVVS
jgi:hypothetical protein